MEEQYAKTMEALAPILPLHDAVVKRAVREALQNGITNVGAIASTVMEILDKQSDSSPVRQTERHAPAQDILVSVKLTCRETEVRGFFGMKTNQYKPQDWLAEPMAPEDPAVMCDDHPPAAAVDTSTNTMASVATSDGAVRGSSFQREDDVLPPVGFEWASGSSWPKPEQWVYHDGRRESSVFRSARCTAIVMQPGQGDVPSLRRDSILVDERRFDTRDVFDLFLSSDRRSGDLVKKLLSPLVSPVVDPDEIKAQKVLSLAWVASQAAYLDAKMDRPAFGGFLVGAPVQSRVNPAVRCRVTRVVNSTDVMVVNVDGSGRETMMSTRDLQLSPLTSMEQHLGQYGEFFKFITAAASKHDDHTSDNARHHHVILTLNSSNIGHAPQSQRDTTKPDLMVLACRGSRSPLKNLTDWKTNLTLGSTTTATHEGFTARADTIPLLILVDHLRHGGSVLLTGHSLGSAVAELVAHRLCEAVAAAPEGTVLRQSLVEGRLLFIGFASPAIGTAAFNDVAAVHARHFYHIVNANDVVPHISNISVMEPKLFEKGIDSAVWLVQALMSSTLHPVVKAALDLGSTVVQAVRKQHAAAPPFEPARGYHFVHKEDNHSISCFFVERGGQSHGYSTTNFVAQIKTFRDTMNAVADHLLDKYEYAVSTRRRDGVTQPLFVPRRGMQGIVAVAAAPAVPEGRMHHHLSQRCLVLTTKGETAQWLSGCDLHARVTLVAGGSQTLLANARMVTSAGEMPADDSAKVYFDAPLFQCAGSVVTLHVTPRYAPSSTNRGVRTVLTCQVERAVDMSVLSTLYQALFLTVGAECSNPFTRSIGNSLEALERIAGNFAKLPCFEDPKSETRQLIHPTVGPCRAALAEARVEVIIAVVDSETSHRLVRHDGELIAATPLDFERYMGPKPTWWMSANRDSNSYDFTPEDPTSPVVGKCTFDLSEIQLGFYSGTYRLTKGGLALDVTSGKLQLQPKRETDATRFLIFEATPPFKLIAPVPTSAPLRSCARVVVHREANAKALDAPTFLSIVTDPEHYLAELPEDENALSRTPPSADVENEILRRDTTTRVVDVLTTYRILPPAVPIHKLLRQRQATREDDSRSTKLEPPVTRYFFCGMATITSWVLEACSVVLDDKNVSRGSWLWELLFSGGAEDNRTAVDKTYVAQLEYLCSLIDDPLFDVIRTNMKHRQLGRGGEQRALKQLHRLLLDFHEAHYCNTDVLHFANTWATDSVPLPLPRSVKGTRAAAVRIMYAFAVTVATIDRSVSECSAVAAFGLKGAGKSTLLHALSHGNINPATRGTDVSTYEAVAFFGQTERTHRVCVVDCPGTNEDRHELRSLQRLMFGAVKLIFVVQSLNKEAQNQLDVLQPVLANANPEATVVVVFTHFASRFAAAWKDKAAAGFTVNLHFTSSSSTVVFDFDGATYQGPVEQAMTRAVLLQATAPTRLHVAKTSKVGTVALLLPDDTSLGTFTKVKGAAPNTADDAAETRSVVVFPYTPPAVSANRTDVVRNLRQRLLNRDFADVEELSDRVVKCLENGQGVLCRESRLLADQIRKYLETDEEADTEFLVGLLGDARKLQKLLGSTESSAATEAGASEYRAYKVGLTYPLTVVNSIRSYVRNSVTRMKEACPALRRTPLHRCVIFQPHTDELLGDGLLDDAVVVKLNDDLKVDVPKFKDDMSLRSAYKLDVMEGSRLRVAMPGDREYDEHAVAKLFEHSAVAGRALFDEDDLCALLLSNAGAPTLNTAVFNLLCGIKEEDPTQPTQ